MEPVYTFEAELKKVPDLDGAVFKISTKKATFHLSFS